MRSVTLPHSDPSVQLGGEARPEQTFLPQGSVDVLRGATCTVLCKRTYFSGGGCTALRNPERAPQEEQSEEPVSSGPAWLWPQICFPRPARLVSSAGSSRHNCGQGWEFLSFQELATVEERTEKGGGVYLSAGIFTDFEGPWQQEAPGLSLKAGAVE